MKTLEEIKQGYDKIGKGFSFHAVFIATLDYISIQSKRIKDLEARVERLEQQNQIAANNASIKTSLESIGQMQIHPKGCNCPKCQGFRHAELVEWQAFERVLGEE